MTGFRRAYLKRIYTCARWGTAGGGLLSVWILVLVVLSRSFTLNVRGSIIPALAMIVVYLLGGMSAGVIVGLAFPLIRWPLGAALVGIAAFLPFAFAVQLLLTGFTFDKIGILSAVIFALIFGAVLGPAYREMFYTPERPAGQLRKGS